MFDRQAVNQVSNDAAEDKAEGELAGEPAGVKVMAAEEQDEQGNQSHYCEQFVVTREQTPSRSGVAPMDKFEKSVDYHLLSGISQESEHEAFGELVQTHNRQSDERNSAVGVSENGGQKAHARRPRM